MELEVVDVFLPFLHRYKKRSLNSHFLEIFQYIALNSELFELFLKEQLILLGINHFEWMFSNLSEFVSHDVLFNKSLELLQSILALQA